MPQARDEAGNLWETDAQGNAVRLLQAAGAQQQSMTIAPNPALVAKQNRQESREDARLGISMAGEGRSAARDAAEMPYIAPKAAADVSRAQADAAKAQLELNKAEKEAASQPDPSASKTQRKLQTDSVLGALNTARSQIGEGYATGNFFGTKGWQSVPVLGQSSTNLAATLSGIQGSIINDTLAALKAASPSGASGYGSLTETEAQRLAAAVGALQQSQDEQSLLSNLAKVEFHYRNSLALLEGKNPYDESVQREYGISQDRQDGAGVNQGGQPPSGGTPQQLTSEGKFVDDPGLRGANATVRKMIQGGDSPAQIRQYLNTLRPGYGDSIGSGIEEAVSNWRLNPNKRREVNIDLEKQWQPASGLSQTLGNIGMSPVGAALIGAGDTASLGLLDNLAGNPEMARAVMAGVQEANPNAYLAGQVGGGVAGALGLGAGLGRAGVGAARAGLGADIAIGAGYGAGSADAPDESRLANALLGGGAAFAGNKVGGALANAGGRLLSGVTDPSRQALRQAGVSMTPGQILGGAAQRTEDRLAGFPIVGDAIQARRREGISAFDQAAFDEALSPIGASTGGRIGEAGSQAAQDAVSQAYRDALGGQNLQIDPQYLTATNDLAQRVQAIPRVGPELYESMRTAIAPMVQGGNISGDAFQDILQGVNTIGKGYRGSGFTAPDPLNATHIAPALNEYVSILEELAERQAPGTVEALRAANTANRNVSTVGDAVIAARNRGGEFMPSQLMNASAANTKAFSGKRAAAAGRGPMFDLARAGQEVLPSQVPDSGTAGRMALPLLAGGALGGGGGYAAEGDAEGAGYGSIAGALLAGGLLAAPYSRGATNALQAALMSDRPEVVRQAGDYLLTNDRIGEILAAPTATLAITQQ